MAGLYTISNYFERIESQIGLLRRIFQDDFNLRDAAEPTRLLDPIQHLPPEISTIIILHTLPPNGQYSSQLLILTSVSRIWSNFLLTTPVLWSDIYLNDRQQDLLATVAIFIHLSGEVALRVVISDRPMNNWAGLSSILAPVQQRITSLAVLEADVPKEYDSEGISRMTSAISDFFDHLGHLPQLEKLALVDRARPTISVFDSLDLPSTVQLSGTLTVPMSPSARSSATSGRFFDIKNYESVSLTPMTAPLFRGGGLALGWLDDTYETTAHMTDDALSQLKISSKYLHGHIFPSGVSHPPKTDYEPVSITTRSILEGAPAEHGLERFTYLIGSSLSYLAVRVRSSEIGELVDFLRVLTRLESLSLRISSSEIGSTAEAAPSSVVVPHLRRLSVECTNMLGYPHTRDQVFRGLFSALTPLYPGVESLELCAYIRPFFASPYMGSWRGLKNLSLRLGFLNNSRIHNLAENYYHPITLRSLEQLTVMGQPLIPWLRTPNLLHLTVDKLTSSADIELLGAFYLRTLHIYGKEGEISLLSPLNYLALRSLILGTHGLLKQVDVLSLSNLSYIWVSTKYFTNPEGNQLCTELLCNPEGCPSLQELHFPATLEWDILFLMLERRNFGRKGVKRIHTVTLSFIPFVIHHNLTLLLTGERAVSIPLESISLEATREVLFDPTV
jgi:hypothetical protein